VELQVGADGAGENGLAQRSFDLWTGAVVPGSGR